MTLKETAAGVFAEECAKRAPSNMSGDAAALCAALALSLGGGAEQPKLTTMKFGGAQPDDGESAPRERCSELSARFFELADADAEAERAVMLAIRKPAMLPGEREEKAKRVLEAQCAAGNVTLNLMRAAGEAAEIMMSRAGSESDLARAGASAGLALCAGAIRALEAEAYARAARITDTTRSQSIARSAEVLCEKYAPAAEETQRKLSDEMRAAVSG